MIFQNFGFNQPIVKAAGGAPAPNYVSGANVIFDFGYTGSYPGSGTTVYDVSGNGRNATLYNSPTFSSTKGGIMQFVRASSQRMIYSGQFAANFTAQLILKYNSTDRGGGYPRFFSTNANLGVSIGWDVGWGSNGLFGSVFHGGAGAAENIELDGQSTQTVDNTWAMISHRGNGTPGSYAWSLTTNNDYTHKITTPGGSYNRTQYTPTNQDIYINYDYQANLYNTMDVMAYLIYDRVLTDSEITQNYNIFSARF